MSRLVVYQCKWNILCVLCLRDNALFLFVLDECFFLHVVVDFSLRCEDEWNVKLLWLTPVLNNFYTPLICLFILSILSHAVTTQSRMKLYFQSEVTNWHIEMYFSKTFIYSSIIPVSLLIHRVTALRIIGTPGIDKLR